MKHIAAYILAVLGGNATPSAEDVTAIITAAGGEADEESLTKMLGDLEGKDVAELMLAGKTRLVETMGSAVMAAGAAAGGGGGDAAAGGGAAAAEAEPEPEPEPEEEIDLGGGMDMFGGGEADY
uniref:60S acidic ribosomal protein P2 n=1 Tax=Pinguiococcus pyrenoidosus TaxID=172671 RepID=A0A7R9Y9N8_9STRA|mmetsp:Transcript_14421/g.54421  ORF Transcript_14421/g.54421 Transcript_14421/m.54421 type:complete len:124 (+) Transcript_14421:60-431(+)|eukprot:scaffold754_cov248-Pinguiococcus_pyrenoidosus.AAC.39